MSAQTEMLLSPDNATNGGGPLMGVGSGHLVLPPVLDACCGSRMMWMDKNDERAIYADRRNESYEIKPDRAYPSGTVIHVRPDVVADFTALPFPDASFWHVVFDPPHLECRATTGTLIKKYGKLDGDWKAMLAGGFRECFRVLKPNGTLVFKWCETQIPLKEILALTPEKPLYGHKGGQKSVTHWMAFLKQNNTDEQRHER